MSDSECSSELSSPSDDENDGKKTDSDGKENYDVNNRVSQTFLKRPA